MEAHVRSLFERDRYAGRLDIELVRTDPVTVRMAVTADHENFYDMAHGGAIFSLADCAFSLASNAAGPVAVAIDTHLAISAPARAGDVLEAVADEVTRGRTLATYRVIVSRPADERVIGAFTGTVFIKED